MVLLREKICFPGFVQSLDRKDVAEGELDDRPQHEHVEGRGRVVAGQKQINIETDHAAAL